MITAVHTENLGVRHSHRSRKICMGVAVVVLLALIGGRIYLPFWLTDYVNNILHNIDGYEGSIENVDVHLYRGAYTIHTLKISKKDNGVPVPFFDSKVMDIALQWSALLHGRIVCTIDFKKPEINFAVNKAGEVAQTGKEVDWTQPIKHLAPFDINLVTFTDGKVAYKNFSTSPNTDIYIHNMSAQVRNLRNVESKNDELPSPITVSGDSIGNGKFSLDGKLNILKPTPDMDLNIKLENAELSAANNYSRAYALVDFKKGKLSVYSEMAVKDDYLTGYVKPVAQDVEILDLKDADKPVKLAWESVVSVFVELFKNHPKDQLATKIPFEGKLNNVQSNRWITIAGIFRNAFIRSFTKNTDGDIDFSKLEPSAKK